MEVEASAVVVAPPKPYYGHGVRVALLYNLQGFVGIGIGIGVRIAGIGDFVGIFKMVFDRLVVVSVGIGRVVESLMYKYRNRSVFIGIVVSITTRLWYRYGMLVVFVCMHGLYVCMFGSSWW